METISKKQIKKIKNLNIMFNFFLPINVPFQSYQKCHFYVLGFSNGESGIVF